MRVHGTRLASDRLASGCTLAMLLRLADHVESLPDLPTDTRWQRTRRGALTGAGIGAALGMTLPHISPLAASYAHLIHPSTRAACGLVPLTALGVRVPTMVAVLGARILLGVGKGPGGADLTGVSVTGRIIAEYGLLGLPEFGLAYASAKLEARGQHASARACQAGTTLLALALEIPRFVLNVGLAALSLVLAIAAGTVGLVVGGLVGSLQSKPAVSGFYDDDPAYQAREQSERHYGRAYRQRAESETDKRRADAAFGTLLANQLLAFDDLQVAPDFMATLSLARTTEAYKEALEAAVDTEEKFEAHVEALERLREDLELAKPKLGRPDSGRSTVASRMALLERVVGPCNSIADCEKALKALRLRVHQDKWPAGLSGRGRELARKSWDAYHEAKILLAWHKDKMQANAA